MKQDRKVLKNTYKILRGFNNRLVKNKDLERLAQKYSCVRSHDEHRSTDGEAMRIFGGYAANIAMGPFRTHLANTWKNSPGHWEKIISSNLMGCTAPAQNCNTIFCYHATKD